MRRLLTYSALRIVLVYALVSGLWVLVSDWLLTTIITEPYAHTAFQTLKGWAFVVVSALVLYLLLRHEFAARAAAETARRASELRLGTVLDIAAHAIIVADVDQRITLFNQSAEHIFGCRSSDLLGQPIATLLTPASASVYHQRVHSMAQSPGDTARTTAHITVTARRHDGTLFPAEMAVSSLHEDSRTTFVVILRDVTERKRAEEALQRERDFISAVLDTSSGLVMVLDREGHIVRFNRACEQATGYPFAEVRGRNFVDLFILPEETAAVRAMCERLRNGHFPSEHEQHWVTRDGTRRLIAWSNTCLLDDGGAVEYIISTGIDITARKRSEQELRRRNRELAVLNTVTAAVSSSLNLTEVFTILHMLLSEQLNVNGGAIFFYDDAEACLTLQASWGLPRPVSQACASLPAHSAHNEPVIRTRDALLLHNLREQPAFRALGLVEARPDWQSYLGIPLLARGDVQGIVDLFSHEPAAFSAEQIAFFKFLGQQVGVAIQNARLYAQVREGHARLQILSRRLLEGQEAERRSIARELHDEIGQALTAIKINLQTLQRSPAAAPVEAALAESIGIVDQALQQVRNLSLDLRPSMLDDLGLVAALRWYVDRQARLAGFVGTFSADLQTSRLPPDLETVCFRVTQEALTNVVRHAHAQHVRVVLQQRDDTLHLTIQDDGVGFDVRAAQARAVRGTSTGLLGMRERVLFAGGQIEMSSTPQQGTVIRMRFPLSAQVAGEPIDERSSVR